MSVRIKVPSWREARIAAWIIKHEPYMLPRSARFIRQSAFWVAVDHNARVIGVVGLKHWGGNNWEMISNYVEEKRRKAGLNLLLIQACLDFLKGKQANVFLCTAIPEYYQRFGFVERSFDCINIQARMDCSGCLNGPLGPGYGTCPEQFMQYQGNGEVHWYQSKNKLMLYK